MIYQNDDHKHKFLQRYSEIYKNNAHVTILLMNFKYDYSNNKQNFNLFNYISLHMVEIQVLNAVKLLVKQLYGYVLANSSITITAV